MSVLAPYYLIFKALHVAFMVTWFAGLFYLPRLFIYHSEASDTVGRDRFEIMEKRLFGIMTIGAALTAVSGVILLGINQALISTGWFQIKLVLIVGLIVYHQRCYGWIVRLREADAKADSRWLRWFNEIPVIFLLSIIILAVTKAF